MTAHAFPDAWRRGVYEAIERRRDVRSFLPDPVPRQTLARVLAAAHHAPSVGYSQPWNFVVIEDRELRCRVRAHVEAERLRAAASFQKERRDQYLSFKLEGILEAPLNVCVTCDRGRFGPAIIGRHTVLDADLYSTCCAVQNLWLAARAEGIGVGWVSVFEPDVLRSILGIPDGVVPLAYLCIGFVESFPERPTLETAGWLPRLSLNEVVYHDRWGEPVPPEFAGALQTRRSIDEPRPAKVVPGQRGLLLVYMGKGKGKTTAALGVVLRALGHGLPAAVVQFIKGKWQTGERLFAETAIAPLTFLVMGRGFTWDSDDLTRDRDAAVDAWTKAQALIAGGEHFVVVLDEITYALNYGFIALAELLAVLRNRPEHVHVIVTGRHPPEELCGLADLVTEMNAAKHPFDRGCKAQRGIDY